MSSYSRGFHFAINCWQFIVVCYLVPGPTPCPEVVAVSYIRPAEVPTLFSVERDAQVEQQNTVVGFLTLCQQALVEIIQLLTIRKTRVIINGEEGERALLLDPHSTAGLKVHVCIWWRQGNGKFGRERGRGRCQGLTLAFVIRAVARPLPCLALSNMRKDGLGN